MKCRQTSRAGNNKIFDIRTILAGYTTETTNPECIEAATNKWAAQSMLTVNQMHGNSVYVYCTDPRAGASVYLVCGAATASDNSGMLVLLRPRRFSARCQQKTLGNIWFRILTAQIVPTTTSA
ncbi:hypothetical protein J6590_004403 [Homalodisca vitripennis]|nr:hypothetical protein J6590_004403 [Homalodisca vitripennis]